MRKIKFIAAGVIAAMTFSCENATEIKPQNSISSEVAYENLTDLQYGMNGVFSNYNPEAVIDISSNISDDTKIGAQTGGQKVNFHNWNISPSTGVTNALWKGHYAMINSANRILEASESITINDGEQNSVNTIKGECYALRALAHLDLMAFYSLDYQAETESIPYANYIVIFEQPSRNTVGEVTEAIKADLDMAESLIPTSVTDNKRITIKTINAIRARLALYTGDWDTAKTISEDLDDTLATEEQYLDMFADMDETEVIFKADRVNGSNLVGSLWMFTGSGGSFIEVSNELADLADDNDVRKGVIFTNENASGAEADEEKRVNKYPGSGGIAFLNDIKVFRTAEMLLINAEAKARLGDFAGAAEKIQTLRTARGLTGTVSYANLNEAIEGILLERRLELCFEGHRFIDIKRTRDITGEGINRSSSLEDCGPGSGSPICELPVDDYRFTLPIPNSELDGNSNISQTQGYN